LIIKWTSKLIIGVLMLSTLTGCVYSNEIKQQNSPATGEYIGLVQNAVDQYIKRNGVPPIQNKDQDTPVYEKYLVDFKKLKNYNLISAIPTNAFENGGTAIYVLINVETKPIVKLMDLLSYQQMVALQNEVNLWIQKHPGQIPKSEAVTDQFYLLDMSKLPIKKVQIQSPYSRQLLSILINVSGRIALDYSPELIKAINKSGLQPGDEQLDLRTVLVDQAFFVPAWSYPYHWVKNQPTIAEQ
jgi:hypothetical protein